MRSTKYTAAVLAPIVESSSSFSDVLRRLGLQTTGGNHRMISARIRQAGIDVSRFRYGTIAGRVAAIPRETLEVLIQECLSVAQVLTKLQMPTEGRSHRELTHRIQELEIETSHFRGRGWSRGETKSPIL